MQCTPKSSLLSVEFPQAWSKTSKNGVRCWKPVLIYSCPGLITVVTCYKEIEFPMMYYFLVVPLPSPLFLIYLIQCFQQFWNSQDHLQLNWTLVCQIFQADHPLTFKQIIHSFSFVLLEYASLAASTTLLQWFLACLNFA